MSPAFHLLWLLLLLCSLLLLVGCRATMVSTPTSLAPSYPSTTLTIVAFPIITLDTVTPIRPIRPTTVTAVPRKQALLSPPTLPLEMPTCYEQPTQQILCLGRVTNTGGVNIQDIQVEVQLGDDTQVVTLEQRMIIPNDFAPYRAQFPNTDLTNGVSAQLLQARASDLVYSELLIENETGIYQKNNNGYGYYDLSAIVTNPTLKTISHPRLIVTLFNEANIMVGYRVVDIASDVRSQENIRVETQIIPQLISDTLYHYITIENAIPSVP